MRWLVFSFAFLSLAGSVFAQSAYTPTRDPQSIQEKRRLEQEARQKNVQRNAIAKRQRDRENAELAKIQQQLTPNPAQMGAAMLTESNRVGPTNMADQLNREIGDQLNRNADRRLLRPAPVQDPIPGDVHVRAYIRSNGTFVQDYYRTRPDGTPYNNYSTYPNVNPYTGKVGTKHP